MSRDTSISAPRKRLFSIITLLLPVILLLLLEGSIRLMGVAEDYPLFISAEGLPGYRQPNPAVISRYFGTPSAAPEISPDTHYFLAQKPEDGFRIFVMGGSSAAGFPYGRFGSISGMLQQRVKRLFPDKEIEIISVAMSAINSYAIRDFSDEVLAAQPDLVLIYAGHNEYLGIMGTGAVFSSFAGMHQLKLVYLALLDSHLFRLLQQVIIPLTSGEDPEVERATLMARVAAGQRIPLADNRFEVGVAQFQDNIGTVLQRFKENDVPVMLGTLVSNEEDLAPFVSGDESPNADECYQKGQTLAAQGQFGQALEQFQLARDLDLLRFRAPGIFNETLRFLAAEYDAILVDVESSFRRSAEHGLIGNQLLLEHVHPNRYGYFLMTEAYVEALIASGLLGESTPYPSTASWQEIPLTNVDLLVAEKKIKNITTQFPFTDAFQYRSELPDSIEPELLRLGKARLDGTSWLAVQQDLLSYYQIQKEQGEAARMAALLFDAIPNQARTAYVAGQLYFAARDWSMALYYHKKAIQLAPDNIDYLMMAGRSFMANNQPESALVAVESVLTIDPDNKPARYQQARISQMLEQKP